MSVLCALLLDCAEACDVIDVDSSTTAHTQSTNSSPTLICIDDLLSYHKLALSGSLGSHEHLPELACTHQCQDQQRQTAVAAAAGDAAAADQWLIRH
eukprot:9825-Heterococcus_DN1.PRE.2